MIYEDIAAAVAVALFIWLVPVRRNGIPGLRGRGKLPPGPPPPPSEQPPPAPLAKVLSLSGRRREQLDRDAARGAHVSEGTGAGSVIRGLGASRRPPTGPPG